MEKQTPTPSRLRIAAGRKIGSGPLVPVPPLSPIATSSIRSAEAVRHAEAAAALYEELTAEARKADDFAEADLCEAYAAGMREMARTARPAVAS